jgi:hypothetical protein
MKNRWKLWVLSLSLCFLLGLMVLFPAWTDAATCPCNRDDYWVVSRWPDGSVVYGLDGRPVMMFDAVAYGRCETECALDAAGEAVGGVIAKAQQAAACLTAEEPATCIFGVFGPDGLAACKQAARDSGLFSESLCDQAYTTAGDIAGMVDDAPERLGELAAKAELRGTIRDESGNPIMVPIPIMISADDSNAPVDCRTVVAAWKIGVTASGGIGALSSPVDGTYALSVPACGEITYTVTPVPNPAYTWTPAPRSVTVGLESGQMFSAQTIGVVTEPGTGQIPLSVGTMMMPVEETGTTGSGSSGTSTETKRPLPEAPIQDGVQAEQEQMPMMPLMPTDSIRRDQGTTTPEPATETKTPEPIEPKSTTTTKATDTTIKADEPVTKEIEPTIKATDGTAETKSSK